MMGIGWSEMMVLVIVALLVFGPKELPQVLRTAGGYMRQFRRMTNDLRREFDSALREAERQINVEERSKQSSATSNRPIRAPAAAPKSCGSTAAADEKNAEAQPPNGTVTMEGKAPLSAERVEQERK